VTPQRRAIIQVLLENGSHPTADQVFTQVKHVMPDISPATVYNTLHELVEMGALQELTLRSSERRYDIITTEHAHLVCLKCGQIENVPYNHQALELSPEYTYGFEIIDQIVFYRGYCPTCAGPSDGSVETL